jgi:hypothetical protein
MFERLFGYWVRWQACKMAALFMSGRNERNDEGVAPAIWSATVFFETYMWEGAEGTRDDFGPKEPAELKSVSGAK